MSNFCNHKLSEQELTLLFNFVKEKEKFLSINLCFSETVEEFLENIENGDIDLFDSINKWHMIEGYRSNGTLTPFRDYYDELYSCIIEGWNGITLCYNKFIIEFPHLCNLGYNYNDINEMLSYYK